MSDSGRVAGECRVHGRQGCRECELVAAVEAAYAAVKVARDAIIEISTIDDGSCCNSCGESIDRGMEHVGIIHRSWCAANIALGKLDAVLGERHGQ